MRRRWVLFAGGTSIAGLGVVGSTLLSGRTEAAPVPRLLTDPGWHTPDPAADEAWLAAGRVPGAGGPYADMVRRGLLDLRALTQDNGAVAAGPAPKWNYAWPRDSAFAAVALARTGHHDDAGRVLQFLADVRLDDGGFEARYLLDGGGTPDGRRRQDDGAGWALWAVRAVVDAEPTPAAARARAGELQDLLTSTVEFVMEATSSGGRLPEPSSDYWERREADLTLGTVAPLLAGLHAGAAVFSRLGQRTRARQVSAAGERLAALLHEQFAPSGYARYVDLSEPSGGMDAAVTFLLPPFTARAEPAVLAAFDAYQADASRPAGGLAPGAGWKQDGISWTPETALVACAAAHSGRPEQARAWLDWLNVHRTSWGSIPEKVLADGTPAGPAPLGWSAAAVVLAVDELDSL
ncbi:glycoside hydrolase family 15 protein [Kineococcus sp. SYSU DK003]|uniref:glycoside hydrolase family 15 n=1 Tax=Kineococcus sp. SYSU DK003 TaxID=3383124 RepID=UPI003D7E6A17